MESEVVMRPSTPRGEIVVACRLAQTRPKADVLLARRMLARLHRLDAERRRKLRRLKAAIRGSSYENDLKLAIAADRLLEEIGTGA
jgi:hypothetical protein